MECEHCHKLLEADSSLQFFVLPNGSKIHPACFKCEICDLQLLNQFVEEKGKRYHEKCYQQTHSSKCVSCSKQIVSEPSMIFSNGDACHEKCFVCALCNEKLDGKFSSRDKKFYHIKCAETEFAPKCGNCKLAIIPGSNFISYNDVPIHNECFICKQCRKPIASKQKFRPFEDSIQCDICMMKSHKKEENKSEQSKKSNLAEKYHITTSPKPKSKPNHLKSFHTSEAALSISTQSESKIPNSSSKTSPSSKHLQSQEELSNVLKKSKSNQLKSTEISTSPSLNDIKSEMILQHNTTKQLLERLKSQINTNDEVKFTTTNIDAANSPMPTSEGIVHTPVIIAPDSEKFSLFGRHSSIASSLSSKMEPPEKSNSSDNLQTPFSPNYTEKHGSIEKQELLYVPATLEGKKQETSMKKNERLKLDSQLLSDIRESSPAVLRKTTIVRDMSTPEFLRKNETSLSPIVTSMTTALTKMKAHSPQKLKRALTKKRQDISPKDASEEEW